MCDAEKQDHKQDRIVDIMQVKFIINVGKSSYLNNMFSADVLEQGVKINEWQIASDSQCNLWNGCLNDIYLKFIKKTNYLLIGGVYKKWIIASNSFIPIIQVSPC